MTPSSTPQTQSLIATLAGAGEGAAQDEAVELVRGVVVVADQGRGAVGPQRLGAAGQERRRVVERQEARLEVAAADQLDQPLPGRQQLGQMLAQHQPALDEGGPRRLALAQVPGPVGGPGAPELLLQGRPGQVLGDRPERDRGHSAASTSTGSGVGRRAGALRLGQRPQRVQIPPVGPGVVDAEMHRAVAEALQRLAHGAHAAHALAADLVEVDLDRHHLLVAAGLVQHMAGRVDDAGLAHAAGTGAVDVEHVGLEDGGTGLGDVDVDVAVDGVGHHRVQDHLRPHGGDRAHRLREPDVVAVEDGEPAGVRHVEDAELVAGGHPLLERQEREHLAVAGDDIALRVDHRGGVVDAAVTILVERARDQPHAELGRHRAQLLLGRPGQTLRPGEAGAEHAQLAEHHHLHPGIEMVEQPQAVAHRLEIVAVAHEELHAGDRERCHGLLLARDDRGNKAPATVEINPRRRTQFPGVPCTRSRRPPAGVRTSSSTAPRPGAPAPRVPGARPRTGP